MKKNLPYFPFYPADFLLDERVEDMSHEQIGAYILLLCRSWRSSEPGYIPCEAEHQAKLARMSLDRWMQVGDKVLACFPADDDGRLCQPRLRSEYQKARRAHDARVKGGKTRARQESARTTEGRYKAQEVDSSSSPQAEHQDASSQLAEELHVTDQNRAEKNKEEKTKTTGVAKPGNPVYAALESRVGRDLYTYESHALADLAQRLDADPITVADKRVPTEQALLAAIQTLKPGTRNVKQWLAVVLDTARREHQLPTGAEKPTAEELDQAAKTWGAETEEEKKP